MAKLELRDITYAYNGAAAPLVLDKLNARFAAGQAVALLGPSGCGKTTLLNILSGLLRPRTGTVQIDGNDVTLLPPAVRKIAQVFQFPVVYENLTAAENLAFPLRTRQYSRADIAAIVTRIATLLDLTAVLHHKAGMLGAEQRQLIALGRGLVRRDVNAILLDEALTAIDPYEKWIFRRKLKELQRHHKQLMIYVTHDQSEALTFADQVMVMKDGRVVQTAAPEELFERPRVKFVGYFIGNPGMNFLPLVPKGAGLAMAEQTLVPLPRRGGQSAVCWELGIRPEYVKLSIKPGKQTFVAKRLSVTHMGSTRLVKMALSARHAQSAAPLSEVMAKVPAGTALPQKLYLSFPRAKICVYADGVLVPT